MKTISRIAYSNDKKNKTRSILIMMSICLTTMLLVIISTVGNGMIRLQNRRVISPAILRLNRLFLDSECAFFNARRILHTVPKTD